MSITMKSILFVFVSLPVCSVDAFVPAPPQKATTLSTTRLFASGGKGFGSSTPPKKKSYNEESNRTVEKPSSSTKNEINQGQQALQELRRQRAEQKDEELRKMREIKSVDDYISQSPDAAVIPEKVAMRMGKRMLPFVGLPLFGGMGAFVAFWYLATYNNVEFEPSLVAFTTIGILALGLVVSGSMICVLIVWMNACRSLIVTLQGITYSVMSASWDEDIEGSALGWEEFTSNVDSLKSGLSRSRENLVTRERMEGMSEAEIQAALKDLEKRETPTRTIKSELKDLQKDNQWSE